LFFISVLFSIITHMHPHLKGQLHFHAHCVSVRSGSCKIKATPLLSTVPGLLTL
jgi:hypothetical protein